LTNRPNNLKPQGIIVEGGLSTVDLLLKKACFVRKKKKIFSVLKAADLN